MQRSFATLVVTALACGAGGLSILLISSELPELLGMSDRILVMREGRLVAEIPRSGATEERVVGAAAGLQEAVA